MAPRPHQELLHENTHIDSVCAWLQHPLCSYKSIVLRLLFYVLALFPEVHPFMFAVNKDGNG